jgi:hypothetical protein
MLNKQGDEISEYMAKRNQKVGSSRVGGIDTIRPQIKHGKVYSVNIDTKRQDGIYIKDKVEIEVSGEIVLLFQSLTNLYPIPYSYSQCLFIEEDAE